MNLTQTCAICGTYLDNEHNCRDYFHLLCGWELDHDLYDLHHLMVLTYHLQHPHLYSMQALTEAKKLLVTFLEDNISTQFARQNMKDSTIKIAGTVENHGDHAHAIIWTMTVRDVIDTGISNYYASIQQWAEATLHDLRASANL